MEYLIRFGTLVRSSDGAEVGSLFRAVIDANTLRVAAVTVERPLRESGNLLKPGGWTKPRDKVVALDRISSAREHEVALSMTRDEFLAAPDYITGSDPQPDGEWTPPASFAAEDVTMRASNLLGGALYVPPHDDVENRGPDDRHLSTEAAVWRREPHTHLGDVDGVVIDGSSNTVSALLVRRGRLFGHEVRLPVAHIVEIFDDLIHVDLSDAQLRTLEAGKPGD